MLISMAQAHGLLGGEAGSHDGPLILLMVATVVVLLLVAEKKWRRRRLRLLNAADQAARAATDTATAE